MPRLRPFLPTLLALGLLLSPLLSLELQANPRSGRWAHEGAKLAPDELVVWGKLENGFRYALRPHRGVPGRVVLQLIVLTGSLDERPDELGIAHYLEHMAFGGTKDFLPGQMVLLFQRLGIEYGSDVNAHTAFDSTVYRLDYRSNDPVLLRDGLRLFRGFADGITFDPQIIERERRVVLAELRLRNTMAGKKELASMPVVFRGLKFPDRLPGGSSEQISRFTREQFLAFYERNYRPDLMVLVATGDVDPDAMQTQIRDLFGGIAKPTTPVPVRDEGKLNARALRAGVLSLAGMGSASTEAATIAPVLPGPETREARVERHQREFIMRVFGERLGSQVPGVAGPEASYGEMLGYGVASASLNVGGQNWAHGILALDQMVRTTLERGLDPVDLEQARTTELRMIQHLRDQIATVDPAAIADSLVDSITSHRIFLGLERETDLRREWLEKLTPAEAQAVFRRLWNPATMAFHVSGGVGVELKSDKVLDEVQKYRKGKLNYLPPRPPESVVDFKLPTWGPPTEITARTELPTLGAQLLRFGNHVRLNFVPTRQEPGLVHINVRVGNGLLEMPGNRPALKEFGLNTLLASGTAHIRPDNLRTLIEKRFLAFSFDVSDRDAFTFRGTVAADELVTFLGVVTDFLNGPRFSSIVHAEQRMSAAMGRMAGSTGMGDGMRALNDRLFKGDARFTSGSPIDYISMSVLDVRKWMEASLKQGYVEATIVGDVTSETAFATFARTLGSLPPRAETKQTERPVKPAVIAARPGFERIEFTGEQNTGLVIGTWPVTEMKHVRDQAALEVLAKIVEIRVRTEVREKLGLAYSPSAELTAFDGFPGFALLQAQIDCSPDTTEQVARLVESSGADLAEKGVSEGEFMGSRGILKSQLQRSFRENSFLVNLLARAQERPSETKEIVDLHDNLVDSVTLDEVNAWATRTLARTNCRAAAVVPKAFIGIYQMTEKP